MTSIGLVLDFVGVTLIAISSVGFVDLPGGGRYAPPSANGWSTWTRGYRSGAIGTSR